MKVVLFAGGLGTRISEETDIRPKPMVEIGGKPVLWHIMKIYSQYGYNDFIICLGYKGFFIKEYFANYFLHQSDLTIDLSDNSISPRLIEEINNKLIENAKNKEQDPTAKFKPLNVEKKVTPDRKSPTR